MDVTVCKKSLALSITKQLIYCVLFDITIVVHFLKHGLHHFGMDRRTCSAENVEIDIKPFVYFPMKLMILVAYLAGCKAFLLRFCLRGGSILIGTANVKDIVGSLTGIASINIS